jgi:hypothetical protein
MRKTEDGMTKEAGHFSTFDAMKIFKMSRGRLKNFIEQGFITPTYQDEFDSGMKRSYFDHKGLYLIRLFTCFMDLGLTREHASMWIHEFETQYRAMYSRTKKHPELICLIQNRREDAPFHVKTTETSLVAGNVSIDRMAIFLEGSSVQKMEDVSASYVLNFIRIVFEVDEFVKEFQKSHT